MENKKGGGKSNTNIANSILMPETRCWYCFFFAVKKEKKQYQHREQHLDARKPVLVFLFFCGKKKKKSNTNIANSILMTGNGAHTHAILYIPHPARAVLAHVNKGVFNTTSYLNK